MKYGETSRTEGPQRLGCAASSGQGFRGPALIRKRTGCSGRRRIRAAMKQREQKAASTGARPGTRQATVLPMVSGEDRNPSERGEADERAPRR